MLIPLLLTWLAASSLEEALVEVPEEFVTDIGVSEQSAEQVATSLKRSLVKGLRTGDWALVRTALTRDFLGRRLDWRQGRRVPDARAEIRVLDPERLPAVDGLSFAQALEQSFEEVVVFESVRFKFFEFRVHKSGEQAYARAHLDLGGKRSGGGRFELHSSLDLGVVREDRDWKVRRLEIEGGHGFSTAAPAFVETTDLVGFHFNDSQANQELIQSFIDQRRMLTIGGLSALDWNRDGLTDLLATRRDQLSVLFVNDGEGGFRREPLPFEGARHSGYLFLYVDMDNDGLEELIGTQILDEGGEHAAAGLWTRRSGSWELVAEAFPFSIPRGRVGLAVQAMDVADLDGDGLLDVIFGVHSHAESGQGQYNSFAAFDGAPNLLFMNQGGLQFREESRSRGLRGEQYTYITRFHDIDHDGDMDLFEGNDFGPNWLYENVGDGHFERLDQHPLSGESSYSMGLSIADFDHRGVESWYLSNMYSHAGNRIVPLAPNLSEETRRRTRIVGQGNQLFTPPSGPGDGWVERGIESRSNECGWAWASVFFDFDNDLDRDLFVTNGNTSHRDAEAPDW